MGRRKKKQRKQRERRRRALRHLIDLLMETAAAYLAMALRDVPTRRDVVESDSDESPERGETDQRSAAS